MRDSGEYHEIPLRERMQAILDKKDPSIDIETEIERHQKNSGAKQRTLRQRD